MRVKNTLYILTKPPFGLGKAPHAVGAVLQQQPGQQSFHAHSSGSPDSASRSGTDCNVERLGWRIASRSSIASREARAAAGMFCHVIPQCIISSCIILCRFFPVPYQKLPCYIITNCIGSGHIISCHIISCHIIEIILYVLVSAQTW